MNGRPTSGLTEKTRQFNDFDAIIRRHTHELRNHMDCWMESQKRAIDAVAAGQRRIESALRCSSVEAEPLATISQIHLEDQGNGPPQASQCGNGIIEYLKAELEPVREMMTRLRHQGPRRQISSTRRPSTFVVNDQSCASTESEKPDPKQGMSLSCQRPSPLFKTGTLSSLSRRSCAAPAMTATQTIAPTERSIRALLNIIVNSQYFEVAIGVLVLLNAISIGAEVDYKAEHVEPNPFFINIQYAFCSVFLLELALRLGARRLKFFIGRDRMWNMFDAAMVAVSVMELLGALIHEQAGPDSAGDTNTATDSSTFLRIIRLSRLGRIGRLCRFAPQLRVTISTMLASLQATCWMAVLMVSVFYVFSVCFTMAATDYLRSDDASAEYAGPVNEYYGNVMRSIYTCYRCMTNGQSWGEVLDPLFVVGPAYGAVFLLYITVAVFAMMNTITAVFVDIAMTKSANDRDLIVQKELEEKRSCVEHIKDIFMETDMDRSGGISLDEFERSLAQPEVRAYLEALKINTTNLVEVFKAIDADGDGLITDQEFVDSFLALIKGRSMENSVHEILDHTNLLVSQMQTLMLSSQF